MTFRTLSKGNSESAFSAGGEAVLGREMNTLLTQMNHQSRNLTWDQQYPFRAPSYHPEGNW